MHFMIFLFNIHIYNTYNNMSSCIEIWAIKCFFIFHTLLCVTIIPSDNLVKVLDFVYNIIKSYYYMKCVFIFCYTILNLNN